MAIIKQGANGSNVKKLQKTLNKHGAKPKLVDDGIFGPKTDTAVRSFQKDSGLKVDGVVGKNTGKSLGYKPTTRSKTGVLFPVWDFGNYYKALYDQLDTIYLYKAKHKKLSTFMEKYIQTRVKKIHSNKGNTVELKKAAELINTRYFEMKRAFKDVVVNYDALLNFLAVLTNLQEIHRKAVRDGKVILAESAVLTAEKLLPKHGMHLKRSGKYLDAYDVVYGRMKASHVSFVMMGGEL